MRTHFLTLILAFVPALVTAQGSTPQQIADELLAADRAFAAASAKTDLVSGISAMFAADVAMPAPGGIAYGADKATDALRANPANKGARVEWTPARVGISGDGRHGFTAGYMMVTRADGTPAPGKYLAYWEKQPGPARRSSGASGSEGGWRILAYKRVPVKGQTPAKFDTTRVLPKQITAGSTDAVAIAKHRTSLAEAERSFSHEAQKIGIGPAFKQFGRPDAINLGPPGSPTFIVGNEAIATSVSAGGPPNESPVSWDVEKAIVAASGDFGVTIGYISPNKPGPEGKTPPQPFFTIWRRDSAADPWRYIAE